MSLSGDNTTMLVQPAGYGGGHDMELLERMMREATTEQQRDAARRLMDAMRNG